MNGFVFAFILISLTGSEYLSASPVENWWERTLAVALVSMLVPAVALFQCGIVLHRTTRCMQAGPSTVATLRRMSVAHGIVWLSASAAIVWGLQWQDVVRGSWGLARWPLIDEILILLPAMLALLCSWLVFYSLQQHQLNPAFDTVSSTTAGESDRGRLKFAVIGSSFRQWIAPRWRYVSLRFRVHFLAGLVPLTIILLILDLNRLGIPEFQLQWLAAAGALLLGLLWPLIMERIWDVKPIADPEVQRRLAILVSDQGLAKLRLRRWETGGHIPNAAVVGQLPMYRTLFLSDVVLDHFPESEISSLVRHELAHLQRHHAWWKLVFLLLPVLALSCLQSCHQSWLQQTWRWSFEVEWFQRPHAIELAPLTMVLGSLLVIAAWRSNRWLFHQLEFEADLVAVEQPRLTLDDMRQALYRLAAYAGADWKRATLFHPSLQDRLEFLDRIENDSLEATRFQRVFDAQRRRVLFTWLMLAACGALAAIF